MKRTRAVLFIVICLLLLVACSRSDENKTNQNQDKPIEVTISAAASMIDALTEIQALYKESHTNIRLLLNMGGSGSLQQQIMQGAPVDLFLSADKDQFHELIENGLIDEKESTDLVGNELVLIQHAKEDRPFVDFDDLRKAKIKKIAIGLPESVPAGKYAKQTLESLDLWKDVESKMIPVKDVRQVLTYVETGNVDMGFVYKTDALGSDQVKVVATADPRTHDSIIYPVGVIKNTKNKQEALNFYEFLQTDQALAIFEKYGFSMLP